MPRAPRIDIPDLLQHVIARGIEKQDIFMDDKDRASFVQRFDLLLQQTKTQCYAWALMRNHFHLLIRPSSQGLAYFMRRLLTGYAVCFNLRHHRCGHLFQNRYKSIVCQEDAYLIELVRYIHLNPLRAGVVTDVKALDRYPWAGHSVLLGWQILGGQNNSEVLSYFGKNIKNARERYRQFIVDGADQGNRDELVGGGLQRVIKSGVDEHPIVYDDRVLGSGEFVLNLQEEHALPVQRTLPEVQNIAQEVAEVLGVSMEEVRQPGRSTLVSYARSIISYIAYKKLGYSGELLAKELGITRSGVCKRALVGEKFCQTDHRFDMILLN
jgi:putative transposase